MNEEVKEILNLLKRCDNTYIKIESSNGKGKYEYHQVNDLRLDGYHSQLLYNYITNLQNEKIELIKQRDNYKSRVENALGIAFEYAQIDGSHHKMWTIDQMVRELAEDYNNWIKKYEYDEETGEEYTWDTGINP